MQKKGRVSGIGTTISGMMGQGSIRHNNREFTAANVDRDRSGQNIVFVNEDLKQGPYTFSRKPGRLMLRATRASLTMSTPMPMIIRRSPSFPFHTAL